MAPSVPSAGDDASRLCVPLAPQPPSTPLVVVGRQWCFAQPVTLRTSHSAWRRLLTVKNETTRETFARIKHTLSAVIYINTQVQASARFQVFHGTATEQVLTVERVEDSSMYDVHQGVFRYDETGRHQPGLFAVTVNSPNKKDEPDVGTATTTTGSPVIVEVRDALTGEPCQLVVEGDFHNDRVALVWLCRGGAWQPVARIHRPARNMVHSELFVLEIESGMDTMAVAMLWLTRWGEFQRAKGINETKDPGPQRLAAVGY